MSNQYQPGHLARANRILETYRERFINLGFPLFGSRMLCSDPIFGSQSAIGSLITHRFATKFEKPDSGKKAELTAACFQSWIDFEEELSLYNFDKQSSKVRSGAYKASALLHRWFKNYKVGDDIEFTPGETFVSNRGAVSIYQKLSRKSNWCVTHDAADAFIRLCYNHTSLKRCAKKFFPRMSQKDAKTLAARAPQGVHTGFWCFSEIMYASVLTLVHGSRSSTVDKSNEKRRFINVEPFCNVILQRCVAQGIRSVLSSVGNDLELGQDVHRVRISTACATVDFSNASDSTLLDICQRLFPRAVTKDLTRYRSPMVLIEDTYYVPVKLSSMGNGFTFEVMSALLLACARVFDPTATVYGDDVIIANESAADFIELAHGLGYKVNETKTFIDSPFRESCGAFFLDGYGYITSFDVHYIECDQDLIVATNKFRLMAGRETPLQSLLVGAYEALLSCVPLRFMGPDIEPTSLEEYVPNASSRKNRMRSTEFVNQWKRCATNHQAFFDGLNWKNVQIVSRLRYQNQQVTVAPKSLKDQGARFAHYLYSGMVSQDTNRNEGVWIENLYYYDETGSSVSVKDVRDGIRKEEYYSGLAILRLLIWSAWSRKFPWILPQTSNGIGPR